MSKTLIVSGFPGVGKSFYVRNSPDCLDIDSSNFDKSLFPQNYIEHIKSQLGVVPIIFVSSHKKVRNALVAEGLHYILVYPDYSLKEEYLARYKKRGSDDSFINLMRECWTDFILDMKGQSGCVHLVLQRREFVSKRFLKERVMGGHEAKTAKKRAQVLKQSAPIDNGVRE